MKKFKQYIKEAPIYNDIEKEKDLGPYDDHVEDKPKRQFISTIGDHQVSKIHTYDNSDSWVNYSLHEPSGKVSMNVHGQNRGNGKFLVSNLNGYQNKIKAHDFYHHLIMNHGLHLHSDYTLSPGAVKVWSKLQKMPDIKMQAYHMGTREYTDINKNESLDPYMDKGSVRFAAKKVE